MKLLARLVKRFAPSEDASGFTLDVEFECPTGVTVVFGASGAGKSLMLDCIAGFAAPDAGRVMVGDQILFDGEAGVNVAPRNRACGYVLQSLALFPHMTIRENLAFAAERRPRLERHRRVNEMIERFHLGDIAGRRPAEVSGGQKQRCSIARALIATPHLLLLDEPAQGLDVGLRKEFHTLLREIAKELTIPLLFVTHDLDEAVAIGSRMLLLENGRIVQTGTPQDVISRPATPAIARLLGNTNVLPVTILALDPGRNTSRLQYGAFELTGPYIPGHLIGDRIHVVFRADDLRVHAAPGENRFRMQLDRRIEHARAVELLFEREISALVPRHEFERNADLRQWYVEIPPASIGLTGGS